MVRYLHLITLRLMLEGAELLVLKGAKSTLVNYSPTIFLATHSHRLHVDCINFLMSLGYKLKPIVGDNLYVATEIFAYKEDDSTNLEQERENYME